VTKAGDLQENLEFLRNVLQAEREGNLFATQVQLVRANCQIAELLLDLALVFDAFRNHKGRGLHNFIEVKVSGADQGLNRSIANVILVFDVVNLGANLVS